MHRRVYLSLSLLCILLLTVPALIARWRGGVSPVRLATAAALAPVQRAVLHAVDRAADGLAGVTAYRALEEENDALQERLSAQETKLREAELVLAENDALRELLDMHRRYTACRMCPAGILSAAQDTAGPVYTLDRGEADGVAVGNAVLVRTGMAGTVTAVGPNWCEMVPIGHEAFRAGVLLLRCRETGIAAGDGTALGLAYLPADSAAGTGDRIITSGLGGAYPPNLLLGYVGTVSRAEDGLSCIATVIPAAAFPAERVFIVTEFTVSE